jgi:HD-GYP domain-containing protein (c-di-GMP phosphodiesterase class II)
MAADMQSTLFDLVICLSNVIDLVSPTLVDHHKRVAYIALKLGKQLGLPVEQQKALALAGALHDVGALSLQERLSLLKFETENPHQHAAIGDSLLQTFAPFSPIATLVRFHHVPWEEGRGAEFQGAEVPLGCHILHLADRVAVLIDKEREILGQVPEIRQRIAAQSGEMFMPRLVEALQALISMEYFWFDVKSLTIGSILSREVALGSAVLDTNTLAGLAKLFHRIIDFRSPYTATHSSGVAATANGIARLAGFSQRECRMMEVAGFLHDLGKLVVSKEILEKPSALSGEEFNVIRSHPFYSYRSLQPLSDFSTINTWAAFHHERLDGSGYPFHLQGQDLPLGARIIGVADVFTALSENRPYRQGMRVDHVLKIILQMAEKQALDYEIVVLLRRNAEEIDALRLQAQKAAAEEFRKLPVGS